jgi:glucose/arabinose dehydrogenase
MIQSYLALFLLLHLLTLSVGQTTVALVRWRSKSSWLMAGCSLLLLLGVALGAAAVLPGMNVAVSALGFDKDRTQAAIAAAAISSAVFVLFGLNRDNHFTRNQLISGAVYLISLMAISGILLKDLLSPYLPDSQRAIGGQYLLTGQVVDGFKLEEVASLQLAPTSMVFDPKGKLFVCGYGGISYQNGGIVEVDFNPEGGATQKDVAQYLSRPHGLAYYNGDLYVSRAGQYSRAVDGKFEQVNTGAVTRLRDLDNDGRFDNYVDVISDLPGAQQPDGLHQNNGIAFDRAGRIYVTVGSTSDHYPPSSRYAGTILRANADGSNVEIFARGFRNPFGIAVGPDEQVFCTDNDATVDSGDKIFHVIEGRHHGHPYDAVSSSVEIPQAVQPLLRTSSAQGLVYVPKGALASGFDNTLYVAGFGDGVIYRVVLTPKGDTYTARLEFFAKIPDVLCLAVSPVGDLYAASHTQRKVYRIRAK